jgi:hypothetical protein
MKRAPTFELLTRDGCHLCDQMATVLSAVLPHHGLDYSLVDVDADAELRERYGDIVPVLLRDGTAVAKVRIDAPRLERIVRRRR